MPSATHGEGHRSAPDDEQLFGLLQFTCGLSTPDLSDPKASPVSQAVTVGDVRELQRRLRSWLVPPDSDFQMHSLTTIFECHTVPPPHTWLLELSRHAAVELRDYSPRGPDWPPPEGFPGALDWHRPGEEVVSPWRHYLRVQRARDDATQSFTSETDCNDYLIRPSALADSGRRLEPGSLWELQLFFCELLAQRRGAIFASHVSERIYNIWLPPGVITINDAEQRPGHDTCFAMLPAVTVVRRPYRTDLRYAMSLTVIFVPWYPTSDPVTGQNRPRSMNHQEIVDVLASAGGNSTSLHELVDLHWLLSERSPLHDYLESVTTDDRRDFCSQYGRPGKVPGWGSQPLRHWLELLLMTAAERPRELGDRDDDRIWPEQQAADDRILPDEVLRCLRVNAIWSAMLLTDSFESCTPSTRLAGNRWWPATADLSPDKVGDLTASIPPPLRAVFELFATRERAFLPTADDRVDDLSAGGQAHMTWRLPRENILITAYNLAADRFPSFSSLYLVSWFAHITFGVTCAWQTMYSLTHDTDRLTDVAELSKLGHDRIMDLEDVYEFDVAWPTYAQLYRHVRRILGVDKQYTDIKERLNLLFQFAQVEQRTKEERIRYTEIKLGYEEQQLAGQRSHKIENAAALIGAFILFFSILVFVVDYINTKAEREWLAILIAVVVIIVAGIAGFYRLRMSTQKIDSEREEKRTGLARLLDQEGPPSVGRNHEPASHTDQIGRA